MTIDTRRLTTELLAVADALRAVRFTVCRLLMDDTPDRTCVVHVRTISVEGMDVILALEALAGKLAEAK